MIACPSETTTTDSNTKIILVQYSNIGISNTIKLKSLHGYYYHKYIAYHFGNYLTLSVSTCKYNPVQFHQITIQYPLSIFYNYYSPSFTCLFSSTSFKSNPCIAQYYYLSAMCYLKNLVEDQENCSFDDLFAKEEESSKDDPVEQSILLPCPQKNMAPCWSPEQQKLVSLFSMIQRNNSLISSLQKSLGGFSQQLKNFSIQTEQGSHSERESKGQEIQEAKKMSAQSDLVDKIFGEKTYKYRIQAKQQLPQILYKQRNFNLELRLVDAQGKPVKNCNVINLCFAACSEEGQWILENRMGEFFMKGKTESQMIKGECQFKKLYAREVSRIYPSGKINFIVYPKPSTLVYNNPSVLESFIDYKDIEPLAIETITIKAKKKE